MTKPTESVKDNGHLDGEKQERTMKDIRWVRLVAYSVVIAIIVIALYLAQLYSYLLFHSIIELASIIVAFGVFVIGWNTFKFSKHMLYLYLGIVYLFVACVDLAHTLAYSGMGVFPGTVPNLATELWIAARYLNSVSLLIAPFVIGKQIRRDYLFAGFLFVTSILLTSIFIWDVFPDCFIEGSGLTPFKILSEYIISGVLVATAFLFYRKRKHLDLEVFRLLIFAILFTIGAEMSFTLYTDVYGFSNMIGHYFKMVSFIFIYGALIHASLNKPYETLFIDLKQHEQRLAERTIELEATNKELEAFSYSVSHDLKRPLGTMDGFSKLLLSKHAEGLDDKAKHYLERIRAGTQHMARIIDDLLKLSRLSRTVIHRQTVDLTAISRKIAVELQQSEPDRKAKFVIEEELVLYCDPGQLRIAMTNLLHNAWKFTLHSPETLIEVGRTNRNGHTVFFIRDNGVGFDMDYAAKMFTPFQRFHSEIEFEGSGIGLATVNRIVNRHGGAIWAEAAVGKGATFFFRLDGGVTNNDHE